MNQPSSTPLFDDQPMIMDSIFDMPLDDWPETEWAPENENEIWFTSAPESDKSLCFSSALREVTRAPENENDFWFSSALQEVMAPESEKSLKFSSALQENTAPNTEQGQSVLSAPQEVASLDLGFPNTNQFVDGDLTTADSAHQIFDYGTLPSSTVDRNGTVLSTSSHYTVMETLSQVSGIPTEGNPLLPLDPGQPNQDEHERLHPLGDIEYLKSLPCSVLKELSKNVAEALATAKQTRKKPVESGAESNIQVHGESVLRSTASKSSTISDVLRCEYPRCTATFRRNKDRLRHFRQKHESNSTKFPCPVVDCPSGFRHEFPRSDNLREHLRAEKTLNLIHWSCVLPGCSEILRGRTGLIDHLGQHDYNIRSSNRKLLVNYGFAYQKLDDYLWAKNICSIPGCPFGTDDKDAISAHLSIHHDGPFCPCPIPSCQRVSQDFHSAFTHLAREHDHNTRHRFDKEIRSQFLYPYNSIFLCPICHREIRQGYYKSQAPRLHCRMHTHQELHRVSEALLKAWTFSFGSKSRDPEQLTFTRDMIIPYILLSDRNMKKHFTK